MKKSEKCTNTSLRTVNAGSAEMQHLAVRHNEIVRRCSPRPVARFYCPEGHVIHPLPVFVRIYAVRAVLAWIDDVFSACGRFQFVRLCDMLQREVHALTLEPT